MLLTFVVFVCKQYFYFFAMTVVKVIEKFKKHHATANAHCEVYAPCVRGLGNARAFHAGARKRAQGTFCAVLQTPID